MSDLIHVLLVEDSATDAKLVIHALGGAAVVHSERVEDAVAMRAALATGRWNAIVSDWSLPKFSGLEALALMKDMGIDLPFIIVSGTIGEESAVEAMRAGAHDYVLKDKLTRLAPALDRELEDANGRAAQRRAEEALRAQEVRFRAVIEHSQDGIVLTSREGKTLYMSPAAKRIVTAAGGDETDAFSFIHPDDRARIADFRAKLMEQPNASAAIELRALLPDGTARWVEAVGTNLLDEPTTAAIVANLRDVTERKLALDVLRRTEEQLRQSQKMEAIGILAGGVAHDFNNVLSVILSCSEMLMEDLPEKDPMRDDVREINEAGQRAATLTRQLLSFSRQQVIDPKVLDLNEIIRDMDKMLRRIIREDVELTTIPFAGLGKCKSDAGQLEQIIMNLVVNARDAMPEGGKLTVETANVELDDEYAGTHLGVKPGRYVMLAISDTGTGMDKATQARIFEPFFTTKETGKGTGLGLSTVFGIAEQSGGSVWVYSELGRGTTFKVYIPSTDEMPEAVLPKAVPATLRGTETVLLVEDEDQIRNVAREILQRHGYRVIECRNPGEALLTCEQHRGTIHLMLSDVVMPQMNGKQLADRLAPVRPEMKVLFMSGYTDGALVGQLAAGAAFLQKPLTPAALTRKVRELLDAPDRQQPH